jgi:hypothetical protein
VTVNLAIEDAQGALTQPWQSTFSLGAGVSASVDDLDLRLGPAQLLHVEEQRPGQLRVNVMTDDGDVTNRAAAILSALPSDLVPMSGDRFAWPREKSPSMWTGFRERRNGEARPLENVALREISNAIVALCADCGGMSAEELHRETVAVFGGRRLTNGMTDRIAQALVLSERDGRLAKGRYM